MHCGGEKIWYHCESETKFMDYSLKMKHLLPKSFSLTLVTNFFCIKKRKSLLITNINHSLGDNIVEGTVSEPKCKLT